jgi:toxin-antitoxin system PIN domain toxin
MTVSLVDVNVLLALGDPGHVHHASAVDWFRAVADQGWATCPIVQNGFVRISSQPSYPRPCPVAEAVAMLRAITSDPDHHFWADTITLADPQIFDTTRLLGSGQITDAYLLAIAVRNGGRFVTFDRRIDVAVVRGGKQADLLVL